MREAVSKETMKLYFSKLKHHLMKEHENINKPTPRHTIVKI